MRSFSSLLCCQLTHLQGDNDKWMRPPTSLEKLETPIYQQVIINFSY